VSPKYSGRSSNETRQSLGVSASEKRSHSRRVWPEPGIHYQNPAGKDAVGILY
jgi:hypothetical protein